MPHLLRYARMINAGSAIDIGCGNGTTLRDLSPVCSQLVGIDPSESGIEEAKKNCPSAKFYTLGVYDSPDLIAESGFDLAIATEVVEHLFRPRELLRLAHNKLRKGGLLVLSTPYHGWLKNVAISALNKWDCHHTVFWDGGHIKFWSRATLGKLLEEEGFDIVGFHGCGRAPYLWASMVMGGMKK